MVCVCGGARPHCSLGTSGLGSRRQSFVLCPGHLLSVNAWELVSVEYPHLPEPPVSQAWTSCPREAGR